MIYFLRHGESEANLQHVFAGQKDDSPLTDTGRKQASDAAVQLENKGITKIIATTLSRASETASIVAGCIGCTDVVMDDRLLEYDMGSLTGTPNRSITSEELVDGEGAEDPRAFQLRVIAALKDIQSYDGNTLIVSHAGVGRIIEITRQGSDPRSFYAIAAYPNAKPIELDLAWLT